MTLRLPRITVVLPVYNGKMYVREAIQSVLDQTFADFELLVIDDGSTDGTLEVLSSFTDSRLRIISFPTNQGLVTALNTGLSQARTEFIARMDADDICMPQRFERQVRFLEAHPDVSICGTWMREFGACDHLSRPETEPEQIRAGIFFGWVISHPTIMMRRSFFEESGLSYDEEFRHAEDFDLMIRASAVTRLANLPEILVHHRKHDRQVSAIHRERQRQATGILLARQLRALMPQVTEEDQAFHIDLANADVPRARLGQAEDWLVRLDRANLEKAKYHVEYFRRGLCRWWFDAHSMQAASAGLGILKSYWTSPFSRVQQIGWYNQVSMAARCTIRRPPPLLWKSARRFVERLRTGAHKHKGER
jgi:glycosyltransferase involved in cell wall biosynthesis